MQTLVMMTMMILTMMTMIDGDGELATGHTRI
jgi:hypothetical protein